VEKKQRRRVRLLSAFLLLIAINTLIGAVVSRNAGNSVGIAMLAAAVILVVGYGLSRTRHYGLATVLAVIIPSCPIFAMILSDVNQANIPNELPWLALPLLVSSLLLPLRSTVIIAVSYVAFIAIIMPFVSIPIAILTQSLAFMLMIFFFVVAVTAASQQDQSETEHELTERKRAEEKLRESERKYRTLVENIPEKIFYKDVNSVYVSCNNNYANDLKIKPEEISGRTDYDFYPKDLAEKYTADDKRIIESGQTESIEERYIQDGQERVVQTFKTPVIDEEGNKAGVLGVFHDITERKRAEEKLRESEAKYRAIFEQAADSVAIVNIETEEIIDFNDKAYQNLGYSREEFAKLKITDIDILMSGEEVKKRAERAAAGEPYTLETKHRTKNGEIRDVLVNARSVNIGGKNYSIGIWHDVTEHKQYEEKLEQALVNLENSSAQLAAINKELEAFSYSVSHDLRAPLRTIDGFSQALLEDYPDRLDEQGRDYLQRVRAASQRMGALIDDLLKLSRLTRSEMHQEPVDLSALAREVATNLQQTQPERRVNFVISRGLTASGDHQLLRVALENLLGNAWKFTGKCPQARIEFGAIQNGDKKAYFVRDNGAGFDMTYAGKLFGAFQRLHETTEFPGTGIGLATVQRIIHRHGGRVWAEGAVGKGATFYFTLS
jgi:PAS domain S-box-containing protein